MEQPPQAAVRITLYGKGGCHLCEVAHTVIDDVRRALAGQIPTRLEVVDVTSDAELLARYRFDVPVVALDGVDRFRHRVDAGSLRSALEAAARDR